MKVVMPKITVQDFVDFFVPFYTNVTIVEAYSKEVFDNFIYTPTFQKSNVVYHGNYEVVLVEPKDRNKLMIVVRKPKKFKEKA